MLKFAEIFPNTADETKMDSNPYLRRLVADCFHVGNILL